MNLPAKIDQVDIASLSHVSVRDIHLQSSGKTITSDGMSNIQQPETSIVIKKKKVPRRILHFSDGTLEEYSTDEEEQEPPPPPVDPKTLTWIAWMWHYTTLSACKVLNVADVCGEKLAWFFGITSPKYQYAIDEYHRIKAEEEEEKKEMEREAAEQWGRVNHAMSLSQESLDKCPHKVEPSSIQAPPLSEHVKY